MGIPQKLALKLVFFFHQSKKAKEIYRDQPSIVTQYTHKLAKKVNCATKIGWLVPCWIQYNIVGVIIDLKSAMPNLNNRFEKFLH